MKRIYAFIIGLCVTTIMNAQTGEQTSNVIKVNGGLDFVTSKMYLPENLYYGNQIVAHSWRPGVSVSADYEHLWKSGWGVGVNFIYTDTRYSAKGHIVNQQTNEHEKISLSLTTVYIGPSVVYGGTFGGHWRAECALGMGYGQLGGRLADNGGFAIMSKGGIEYMINSHIGVGVELNSLVVFTKDEELEDFKKYYPSESDVSSGVSHAGVAAGLRFHF